MAHPMKTDAGNSSTAKFKSLTRHYGAANPSMNKAAGVTAQFQNGPQEAQGFGVEGNAMPQRHDKASRRAANANPVAAYKSGGRVAARARGGATKGKKGATHVTVVVAPQGQQQPIQPNPALAAAGVPPSPPPKPPMMSPGAMPAGMPMAGAPMMGAGMPPGAMMPPGAIPPGAIPPRKRGGSVKHSDEAEDKALVRQMVKPGALKGRARGGTVHMTAGAESGPGRLEKTEARAKRKAGDKAADLIR